MATPAAYRKASQGNGLWVAMCFLGFVVFHGVIFWSISMNFERYIGAWILVVAFVALFAPLAVGWVMLARIKRQRIGQLTTGLGRLGFRATQKPTLPEREQFAAPILHLFPSHTLQRGAAGIEWFAVEETASPVKILIFEHSYTTGSGKTTQEHIHTFAAWPTGHADLRSAPTLPNAPWFYLGRLPRFLRRAYREKTLTSPEFADLASIWTLIGDATTATQFLTPAVRAALAASPKSETWSVGAGWICHLFKGPLDAENIERFLAHGRGIVTRQGEV